ncbi:MAG TPA: HEAT repeat domain-containing protein [Candidatus Dormibacteraeota bacterium]|nr:HEAT repeat domain-containing protein [Candidatus Dormibacteraeota bacterium]
MNNFLSNGKIRIFLICAALFAAISALLLAWANFSSPREPSYQGKALSAWIVPFCRQTSKGLDSPGGPANFDELQPVRHAVIAIGTNGVPFLSRWMNRPESKLHRFVRQLFNKQPYQSFRLTDPIVERIRAIRALAVLGINARTAVPTLIPTLSDPALATHSVYALTTMGPDGMRALVRNFTNTVPVDRFQIAAALVSPKSIYRGENVSDTYEIPDEVLVQGLCALIENPSPLLTNFRMGAIQRLNTLGPAASNAVPALFAVLNDTNRSPWNFVSRPLVVRTLGKIGTPRETVIPALTRLLDDPDVATQMSAYGALRDFGYNPPLPPPTLIQKPKQSPSGIHNAF